MSGKRCLLNSVIGRLLSFRSTAAPKAFDVLRCLREPFKADRTRVLKSAQPDTMKFELMKFGIREKEKTGAFS